MLINTGTCAMQSIREYEAEYPHTPHELTRCMIRSLSFKSISSFVFHCSVVEASDEHSLGGGGVGGLHTVVLVQFWRGWNAHKIFSLLLYCK